MIQCKRVYEIAEESDGYRVLVDRLWPRGIKKADLKMDDWNKAEKLLGTYLKLREKGE